MPKAKKRFKAGEWDEGYTSSSFKKWKTKGRMTGLVDADLIPYIVGFLQDEAVFLKMNKKLAKKDLTGDAAFEFILNHSIGKEIREHVDSMINLWLRNAECDSAIFYLTEGYGNFRFDVAFSKEYKGKRGAKPKPPFFHFIKWYVKNYYNAVVALDCEADDLICTEQWQRNERIAEQGAKQGSQRNKIFSGTVIISKDKDLRMIAGWHSNPDINEGEPFWVSEAGELIPKYDGAGKLKELKGTGTSFFYAQMLTGDPVDEYQGLPLCGAAKAFAALDGLKPKKMHKRVEEMYKAKYGLHPFTFVAWDGKKLTVTWKDMFVQQGRLAWMRRETGQVWMPKHKLPKWRYPDVR